MKIVFIVGMERSGSTLLQNILGQFEGVRSIGEIRYVYKNFDIKKCGCGKFLSECNEWKGVLEKKYSLNIKQPELTRNRYFEFFRISFVRKFLIHFLKKEIVRLKRIYGFFNDNGGSIIVDSSKNVITPILLACQPNINVCVVHIVRDSRGIENSLNKRKISGHKGYLRHKTMLAALNWNITNGICEKLADFEGIDYFRVKYEDLCEKPEQSMSDLLSNINCIDKFSEDIFENDRIVLKPNHTAGGSPSRYKVGDVPLKEDVKWKEELSRNKVCKVNLITGKKLKKYGYNL